MTPLGWHDTPHIVPLNAAFGLSSCFCLPLSKSNSTTNGLPMPAKAFDTFVMPAHASREPSPVNDMLRMPPWSAPKVWSYLYRTAASRFRATLSLARSHTLTMPCRSAETSHLPEG